MKLSGKQILVLIFGLFMILAILFLWGEFSALDIHKKINHEKLTNFFTSLFTIYGTIGAIYFSYNQYKLARENSESANRPYLLPEVATFKMKDFFPPEMVKNTNALNMTFPEAISKEVPLGVKIKNEGVGPAKNIYIDWQFEKIKIDEIVEGVYSPREFNVLTNPEFLRAGDTKYLPLPNYYLACCGQLVNKDFTVITNIPYVEPDKVPYVNADVFEHIVKFKLHLKPPLSCVVNYQGLHGKEYSKEYKVEFFGSYNDLTFKFQPK